MKDMKNNMKYRRFLTAAAILGGALCLLAGCNPYSEHVMRGTLYTDSTKTTPIAGDTLTFFETSWIERDAQDNYLGQAVTDSRGRWGFQYIRGFKNPYTSRPAGAKMEIEEYFLLIVRGHDTLYWQSVGRSKDTLALWPGGWRHPEWWDPQPDTTTVDTTAVADSTKWRGGVR